MSWRFSWVLAATAGAVFAPATAQATDGIHPRTPVLWDNHPNLQSPACLTTVDRTADPLLSLSYAIPFEDTDVKPAEVDDSRRHQFLAVCRSISPALPPPNWLSDADVTAAAAKDLIMPENLVDEDILDNAPSWAGCYTRITADNERRPITFEMADMPVQFDTTALAPGPWTVWGYTWEPAFNLWSLRPGVINVVDDPANDENLPAMALQLAAGEEPIYYKGDLAHFEACVAAMDGSTVTLEYAISEAVPVWKVLDPDIPVVDGTNAFEFALPDESLGQSMMLRAIITDPMDRTYETYFREHLTVINISDSGGCDSDGGTFIAGPGCGSSGTTDATASGTDTTSGGTASNTGTTSTGTDTDGATSSQGTGGGGGCAMHNPRPSPHALWLLAPLLGFARRRR